MKEKKQADELKKKEDALRKAKEIEENNKIKE